MASAFWKASGLMDSIVEGWKRPLDVPYSSIGKGELSEEGYPVHIDEQGEEEVLDSVVIPNFVLNNPSLEKLDHMDLLMWTNWDEQLEKGTYTFTQVDPELIFHFGRDLGKLVAQENSLYESFSAQGFLLNYMRRRWVPSLNKVGEQATHDKIERGYDREYGYNRSEVVSEATEKWFQQNKGAREYDFFDFHHTHGIISHLK